MHLTVAIPCLYGMATVSVFVKIQKNRLSMLRYDVSNSIVGVRNNI
jgi:hypothetical protein